MNIKPDEAIYNLGETRFRQLVQLKVTGESFSIIKHAANQRDDTERVTGLSLENMRALARILEQK